MAFLRVLIVDAPDDVRRRLDYRYMDFRKDDRNYFAQHVNLMGTPKLMDFPLILIEI